MSDDVAIRMKSVGKMYKLFPSRLDNFLDAINWQRFIPLRAPKYKKFWALRGIDLELKKGHRIGILGRNGAGKSTLLKLITGNLAPTEGEIKVNGQIQALMETGAGFHPEFTGYENVRASLTYLGMSPAQMDEALEDIIDFTELDEFMGQPFKTYSAGMQARLSFATATSIKPDILIIDEVLGAGDAYFLGKSTERMKSLVSNGTSVLLVSHALDTITKVCDQAIWIDRGRIVMTSTSIEVVKSYQRFILELEEERLQAKNYKTMSGTYKAHQLEVNADSIVVQFLVTSNDLSPCECEVCEVRLMRDGDVLESVLVGSPQDSNMLEHGFIELEGGSWSGPRQLDDVFSRAVVLDSEHTQAKGNVVFSLPAYDKTRLHEIEIHYRCTFQARLQIQLLINYQTVNTVELITGTGEWLVEHLQLDNSERMVPDSELAQPVAGRSVSRWPGEGSLRITGLAISDTDNVPKTIFGPSSAFKLRIEYTIIRTGKYDMLPSVVIFRIDGINVSTHIGPWIEVEGKKGERRTVSLILDSVNLGNGHYVMSVGLHRSFDETILAPPDVYDLIDRSVEFQVAGGPPSIGSIFKHPSRWETKEKKRAAVEE